MDQQVLEEAMDNQLVQASSQEITMEASQSMSSQEPTLEMSEEMSPEMSRTNAIITDLSRKFVKFSGLVNDMDVELKRKTDVEKCLRLELEEERKKHAITQQILSKVIANKRCRNNQDSEAAEGYSNQNQSEFKAIQEDSREEDQGNNNNVDVPNEEKIPIKDPQMCMYVDRISELEKENVKLKKERTKIQLEKEMVCELCRISKDKIEVTKTDLIRLQRLVEMTDVYCRDLRYKLAYPQPEKTGVQDTGDDTGKPVIPLLDPPKNPTQPDAQSEEKQPDSQPGELDYSRWDGVKKDDFYYMKPMPPHFYPDNPRAQINNLIRRKGGSFNLKHIDSGKRSSVEEVDKKKLKSSKSIPQGMKFGQDS